MASGQAADDLTLAFLQIEGANDVVPRLAIRPPSDKTREVADIFSDFDGLLAGAIPYDFDVEDGDIDFHVLTQGKDHEGLRFYEPGESCWYDLDDRRAYLQARAPDGRKVPSDFTWARWKRLLGAFEWCCAYCGSQDELEQDHIIPIVNGGTDLMANLLPACHACNQEKAHKSLVEWFRQRGKAFENAALERIGEGFVKYGRRKRL